MLRTLLIILGLVVVLVGGGIVYVATQGGSILRQGVEDYGPDVVGAPVTLSGVGLNVFSGSAALRGFTIGTPDGFTADKTLSVDRVAIDVDPTSLLGDTIRIREIAIDAPQIFVEPKRNGSTNLTAIQKNIEEFTGPSTTEAEASTTKLIIERFVLSDAVLGFVGEDLGLSDQTLELADIELTGIGVDENGVSPGEAARLMSDAIMPQIQKALLSSQGKALLNSVVGDRLDGLGIDTDAPIQEQVQEKAEGLLRGVLGRDKKEDDTQN